MPFADTETFYAEGVLAATDNVAMNLACGTNIDLTQAGAHVREAPTGNDIIVTFFLNNNAQTQTVTIGAGNSSGTSIFSPAAAIVTTDTYGWQVTQVGSTTPGAGLTVWMSFEET